MSDDQDRDDYEVIELQLPTKWGRFKVRRKKRPAQPPNKTAGSGGTTKLGGAGGKPGRFAKIRKAESIVEVWTDPKTGRVNRRWRLPPGLCALTGEELPVGGKHRPARYHPDARPVIYAINKLRHAISRLEGRISPDGGDWLLLELHAIEALIAVCQNETESKFDHDLEWVGDN